MRKSMFLVVFLLTTSMVVNAQLNDFEDIEQSSKKGFFKEHFLDLFKDFNSVGDPFSVGGFLGLNMTSYDAYGGNRRQDPMFYTLNSNLNFKIRQVEIPISFLVTAKNKTSALPSFDEIKQSLSNQNRALRTGFTRLGMSPHYKWMKLHLGDRVMTLSKYSLNNLNFYGVGADFTPGKVRVSAMYGRIAEAIPVDIALGQTFIPRYKRLGWGTRIGYGDEAGFLDLVLFKGFDDPQSITIPDGLPRKPSAEENLVMGVNMSKLLYRRIRFNLEYAQSYVNPNAEGAVLNNNSLAAIFQDEKDQAYTGAALESTLTYEGKDFNAGLGIKRIDPFYTTHGAYFFNRDILDITANTSFGLIKNLFTLYLSGGVQSNNLDLQLPATTRRLIYSTELAFSKGIVNASLNFTNNSSRVGYVLNQRLDSLNAVVITEDLGGTVNIALPSTESYGHSVTLNAFSQRVADDITDPASTSSAKLLGGNLGYNINLLDQGWNFAVRANYNQNDLTRVNTDRIGFGGTVEKILLDKKMKVGLVSNYYVNNSSINTTFTNFINQLNFNYQISKAFGISTNLGYWQTKQDGFEDFDEISGTLGLNYNFFYNPFSKPKEPTIINE